MDYIDKTLLIVVLLEIVGLITAIFTVSWILALVYVFR